MKKLSIKYNLIISIVAIIAIVVGFCAISGGKAQAASYYRFDAISAVFNNDNEVIVSDSLGTYVFNKSGERTATYNHTQVSRIDKVGNTLYLLNGSDVINAVGDVLIANANDFAVSGDKIFVARGNEVIEYSGSPLASGQAHDFSSSVAAVACDDDEVYVSVANGNRYDILTLDGGVVYSSAKITGSICVSGGNVYATLISGDAVSVAASGQAAITDGVFVTAISGDELCYATDDGEVYLSGELFLASASDEIGFYNVPKSVVARGDKSATCDYLNDRVIINDKIIRLNRPIAVDIDRSGAVYVGYSGNKLVKIVGDEVSEMAFSHIGVIEDILLSGENKLYVLVSGKLIDYAQNTVVASGVTRTFGRRLNNDIYVVTNDKITALDGTVKYDGSVCDAAVDERGYIYYAVGGQVFRNNNGVSELVGSGYSNDVRIAISSAKTSDVDSGDILVSDARLMRVDVIKATTALTDMTLDQASVNEVNIHAVIGDCALFSNSGEHDVKFKLSDGKHVIMLNNSIAGHPQLSYVAYSDAVSKKLIYGYVYKQFLSVKLSDSPTPATVAKVYANNTNLYALPSTDSDKLVSGIAVDSEVTLLDFAYYLDGARWYKASYNGKVGFIVSTALSINHFVPGGERPQHNAVIVSKNGVNAITLYEKIDGEFIAIDGQALVAGTEVEVVGAFDTSQKYTCVKYYDSELGTLTCYVLTTYIDYNSVSLVQIVALGIIVVTVIILTIILVKVARRKNR